jgi:hypothetical protein
MEKELELKMPGVVELGREELKKVEGGGLLWDAAAALFFSYILLEAALNPQAHIEAFKEGREIAKNE